MSYIEPGRDDASESESLTPHAHIPKDSNDVQ